MEIAFVAIVGAVFAVSAMYVVATAGPALSPAVGGAQATAVGLADAGAETLANGTDAPSRTDWQLTPVGDLSAAEDLLDCLEAHGYADRELVVLGNSCFAVRWR